MQKRNKLTAALLSAFLLTAALDTTVAIQPIAAAITVSDSTTTAMNKLLTSADQASRQKLKEQYDLFIALQKQDREWDSKVKNLRSQNTESEQQLRKQIQAIDAAKLARLKQQSEQTRARYQVLFDQYAFINRQIENARAVKNKELTAMLRKQAEALKPAVQLARLDIKNKDTALKTARAAATSHAKKVRSTLAGADSHKLKLKTMRSTISASNKKLTAEWKNVTQAVRKQNAAATLSSLRSAVVVARQITNQKQQLHEVETKIADIISKAKGQLPR